MEDLVREIGVAIGAVISAFFGFVVYVLDTLRTAVPGGFGLLLIPLAVLGVITLLVARNR
jgi:hypothetical protein